MESFSYNVVTYIYIHSQQILCFTHCAYEKYNIKPSELPILICVQERLVIIITFTFKLMASCAIRNIEMCLVLEGKRTSEKDIIYIVQQQTVRNSNGWMWRCVLDASSFFSHSPSISSFTAVLPMPGAGDETSRIEKKNVVEPMGYYGMWTGVRSSSSWMSKIGVCNSRMAVLFKTRMRMRYARWLYSHRVTTVKLCSKRYANFPSIKGCILIYKRARHRHRHHTPSSPTN